jgi:uncharacterized membrane protein YqaE (UPF0057 family)
MERLINFVRLLILSPKLTVMKKTFTYFAMFFFAASIFTAPAFAASISEPVSSQPATGGGSGPDKSTVNAAVNEFNSLSRKERRARIKESKKYLKEYRAAKKAGRSKTETDQTLLIILCILLPPLAVYLKENDVDTKFWISLILTLIFWIPGIIYALLVVFDEV